MTPDTDVVVGASATFFGSTMVVVHVATQLLSLTAVFLNVLLALGGLYLLWHRIQKAKKNPGIT